ncbi:hypothetical protein F1737_08275 [Methanoplanus sp. FWC-SCC4]|uniref:KARI N-terminal Rossmann domain-containing protein n=1 Tax=Methanochimaera problematica TaxID=2609417 RepID=A0AA97FC38_9EURY|nr:NAD(P)-binding domain-containing protein [Methanoplanus sp. FWC-SCC4]WOF16685.1 hypothetical protein F1737_08275 [Methanoplanus sp. FWC-SCC4]
MSTKSGDNAGILDKRRISIIGYGNEGRQHAQRLRDSGTDFVIGVRPGNSWERASKDGFDVFSISDAVSGSDVVIVTLAADGIRTSFEKYISPYMKEGASLVITDPFFPCYQLLETNKNYDIGVFFVTGQDISSSQADLIPKSAYISVLNNFSKKAQDIAAELATLEGIADDHICFEDLRDIAESKIFAEEAVMKGAGIFIRAAIATMENNGYNSKMSKEIVLNTYMAAANEYLRKNDEKKVKTDGQSRSETIMEENIAEYMNEVIKLTKTGIIARDRMLSELTLTNH